MQKVAKSQKSETIKYARFTFRDEKLVKAKKEMRKSK